MEGGDGFRNPILEDSARGCGHGFLPLLSAGFACVGSRLVAARAKKGEGKEFTGRYKTAEAFGRDTAELYRQAIVGTLSWATLGLLGSLGYATISGGSEDDKRKDIGAIREAEGEKFGPEMTIGDTAFDLTRMGPTGRAAGVAARMQEAGSGDTTNRRRITNRRARA